MTATQGIFFPWYATRRHRSNAQPRGGTHALAPPCARRIETRAKLPPKLTADHKTLIGMLVTCSESVDTMSKAGSSTSADTVQALRQMYGQLHPGASDHFQEEEEASLPLIRQHFSLNELKEMEAQVMVTYKPSDVAWIVRTLTTPSAKREWMTSVASVQDEAMLPAVQQREACLEVPFKALLKGATEAPQEV
jgi:hypothetical protein